MHAHVQIERFSIECRKTKTKIITLTNDNTRKQRNEPISKCMQPAPSAGKRVRPCHDWFWFSFSLVEKVAKQNQSNYQITFATQLKTAIEDIQTWERKILSTMLKLGQRDNDDWYSLIFVSF